MEEFDKMKMEMEVEMEVGMWDEAGKRREGGKETKNGECKSKYVGGDMRGRDKCFVHINVYVNEAKWRSTNIFNEIKSFEFFDSSSLFLFLVFELQTLINIIYLTLTNRIFHLVVGLIPVMEREIEKVGIGWTRFCVAWWTK